MITGTNSPSSPSTTPLPSTAFPSQPQQQSKGRKPDSSPSPQEESMHHHPARRSNSLHRRASNISTNHKPSGHSNNPQPSAGDSQPQQRSIRSQQTQRRSSESRKQPVKIQNYVIYRKTIGQGSMGKVKLAECLTDRDHQKVENLF